MTPIPILSKAYEGYTATNSVESRINCFPELGDGKTVSKIFGVPGKKLFSDINSNRSRGQYVFNSLLYTVMGSTLYEVSTTGVATSRGTLNTTYGNVCISDNGTHMIIVDGTNGYTYTSGTLTQISDGDFPNGATTVTFIGGYFVVDDPGNTGRFYYSDLYDGTSWTALGFATAESIPDALVRVFEDHGQLILFGDKSIEPWYPSGDADLPFSVVNGASIRWGLDARWSAAQFDNSIAFLGKRSDGALQIVVMSGYQPTRISNEFIEHEIENYTTTSDAIGQTYTSNGHTFYVLSFPVANKTWVYDASTTLWHERKTNGNRDSADFYTFYNKKIITSNYAKGELLQLDDDTYTDNGLIITRSFTVPYVHNNKEMLFGVSLQVEFEQGIGLTNGQGDDPLVMMDYSENGKTWSNKKTRAIGKLGKYGWRTIWRRLGRFRDRTFRITITDPVRFVVTGMYLK